MLGGAVSSPLGGLGRELCPSPENFGTFSLEMDHFGESILTEMLGYLLLGPQQLHVHMYCWRLRGPRVLSNQSNPARYGPDQLMAQ